MVLVYKLENKREGALYMMTGAFLIAIAFIMLEIMPVLSVSLASMVVITFGEMLLFPFMNNFWVKRTNETNRGQYAALYTMSFSAAILCAPTFASQVAARFGFNVLWVLNFFICSFAGLGFLWLKKRLSYE
jgi:predicted MFS family arabinose efflux permease